MKANRLSETCIHFSDRLSGMRVVRGRSEPRMNDTGRRQSHRSLCPHLPVVEMEAELHVLAWLTVAPLERRLVAPVCTFTVELTFGKLSVRLASALEESGWSFAFAVPLTIDRRSPSFTKSARCQHSRPTPPVGDSPATE